MTDFDRFTQALESLAQEIISSTSDSHTTIKTTISEVSSSLARVSNIIEQCSTDITDLRTVVTVGAKAEDLNIAITSVHSDVTSGFLRVEEQMKLSSETTCTITQVGRPIVLVQVLT